MSTTRGWTLGLSLAVALLSVGCARTSIPAVESSAAAPVRGGATLIVQNNNFADVDVFAVQDGEVATRLGMVTGESTEKFTVDPSLFATGQLGLLARPIGGSGIARSGPVLVSSGQIVTFTIQPDLRSSMATVQ